MTEIEVFEQELLKPSDALIADIEKIEGDIIILGVGGKMGPSMAKLARKAILKAGIKKRVIGISKFSEVGMRDELEAHGIETVAADLLNEDQLAGLPDAPNILYLAGTKFGTTGKEPFTWAMNSYLPGRVAERYRNSRIVAFSTGNVYPFVSVNSGGLSEESTPAPVGEYGQSCLGRERLFQYFSEKYNIPTLIYRLNYAIDLRYGVMLEIAHWAVWTKKAVELLEEIKSCRSRGYEGAAELLTKGIGVTDMNAAIFDPAHNFNGCISGIHEVLRRQGLLEGRWCLNPTEELSPGQLEEIDHVCNAYPELTDDEFVKELLTS